MLPTLISHKLVWSILLVIWSADYWGRSNLRTSVLPEPAAYDDPTTGSPECEVAYALPIWNLQREGDRGCKIEVYLNLCLSFLHFFDSEIKLYFRLRLCYRISILRFFIFVYVYAIVLVYYVYIYVNVFVLIGSLFFFTSHIKCVVIFLHIKNESRTTWIFLIFFKMALIKYT